MAAKTNSQPVESLMDHWVSYENFGCFICVAAALHNSN